jgi:hypothetical protein
MRDSTQKYLATKKKERAQRSVKKTAPEKKMGTEKINCPPQPQKPP